MTTVQTEQQQAVKAADKAYEWSYQRIVESITINVVSALLIGLGAVFLGALYGVGTLVASALHTPNGLLGIAALVFLGGILTLVILGIVVFAWIRGLSSATVAGMLLGALVGGLIGAAIDAGKWKLDASMLNRQEQNEAEKKKEP